MKRLAAPSATTVTLPAPLGGLNTVSPAAGMPPSDLVYAYNVIPGALGLESRPGWQEWATGITGSLNNEVRATMDFAGSTANRLNDKVFATSSTGIWDVTSSGAAPTQVLAFADSSGRAGWGVALTMVTSVGHFLLYADEVNGYHVYTESTGTWAKVASGVGPGQVSVVDPASIRHLCVFKHRLWVTVADSATAYYFDLDALYGAAAAFPLGGQFRHGGTLVGLWNWTMEGGAGVDDRLVGVSSGGDVLIYAGTNPSDVDTFGLKGVWYVGPPPRGRRIATDAGGDLLVLSRLGLVSLSRLVVSGAAEDASLYATDKIANRFVQLMAERGDLDGWSIQTHPTANCLLVTIPTTAGAATEQLALSFATRSWWPWRDLPILSSATHGGELYFGTTDGRVCINRGGVDAVLLSDATSHAAVECSILPAFQTLGTPAQKQIQMFFVNFLAGAGAVEFKATAKYRYDTSEPTQPTAEGGGGSSAWDTLVWDVGTWGEDYTSTYGTRGGSGMGREMSVALQWNAISKTTLVGIDVMFTAGGFL